MPPKAPIASLTLSPLSVALGQPIVADPTGSKAARGATLKSGSLGWGDGDQTLWTGKPSLESHSYQKDGTYTVVLTIWDTKGMSGSTTASITVMPAVPLPGPNDPPVPAPEPPPPVTPPPTLPPLPPPGPLWGGTQSPTGRNPLFIASSARQDVWNKMWTDYLANPAAPATRDGIMAKQVKQAAELGMGYYANVGQYATFMFQMTGDPAWAQLAYTQISAWWLTFSPYPNVDINLFRDWTPLHVIMLDWLWPGLTATQRATFYNSLVAQVNGAITNYGGGWDYFVTSGDSDQILGHYFALVLLYLFDPTNTTMAALYNLPGTGGLNATAANHNTTARNAIKQYFTEFAVGGEWIESSEYNPRTLHHNTIPVMEAVLTARGEEHFPEYRSWLAGAARNLVCRWTPDLNFPYQWGDEESPHQKSLNDWANASRQLAGILQGTVEGAQLQQWILDMETKYGLENNTSTTFEPFQPGSWFFTYNPNAPRLDWKTDANKMYYAAGKGILFQKSGHGVSDSLFAVDSGQHAFDAVQGGWWVQHFVQHFMQFQLYKNGEWVLDHPFGYASVSIRGSGTNSPQMHGLNACWEYQRVRWTVQDAAHAYMVATTGGSAEDKLYEAPNDLIFGQEWTRSLIYVPGVTDTVICYDRAHITAITDITKYSIYQTDLAPRLRITGGTDSDGHTFPVPPRKQWNLHTPVSPAIAGNEISWQTAAGQVVKCTCLLPANVVKPIYSEAALRAALDYDYGGYLDPAELKYFVGLHPPVTQDWDTFLNVIQGGGTPGVVTLKSNAGAEGVHVTRPGEADVLAIFNGTPGAALDPTPYHASHQAALEAVRFRATGYSIPWVAVDASTLVYLSDLDPNHNWTKNVDNGGAVSFAPDAGGHYSFTVPSAGAHTLVIA